MHSLILVFTVASVMLTASVMLAATTTAAHATMSPARYPEQTAIYSQEMRDTASAQLARLLGGRSLQCSVDADRSGLFPISLRAVDKGSGRTELSIATNNKRAFGLNRNHFQVRKNANWFLIKDGKQSGRFLYLSEFSPKDQRVSGIVAVQQDDGSIQEPRSVECSLK